MATRGISDLVGHAPDSIQNAAPTVALYIAIRAIAILALSIEASSAGIWDNGEVDPLKRRQLRYRNVKSISARPAASRLGVDGLVRLGARLSPDTASARLIRSLVGQRDGFDARANDQSACEGEARIARAAITLGFYTFSACSRIAVHSALSSAGAFVIGQLDGVVRLPLSGCVFHSISLAIAKTKNANTTINHMAIYSLAFPLLCTLR
jgi:hypothetical protein